MARRQGSFSDRTSWQPRGSGGSNIVPKIIAAMFILVVLAGVVAYLVLLSPLLWVKTVEVKGTKTTDAEAVKREVKDSLEQSLGAISSESLLLFDEAKTEAELKKKFSDVGKVSFQKSWPGRVTVDVTERQSTLLWKSKDKLYLVDQQGVAFADSNNRTDLVSVEDSTGLPVEVGQQVVSAKFIKSLADIQREMEASKIRVVSFRIPESTFEVQAVTDQGYYALFDTTRSVMFQVDALRQALSKGKPREYADLRVPGRVYVR